jgi:poly(3-hydroxybutyrate) depolymerase
LLYHLYELNQVAAAPLNAAAGLSQFFWAHPSNPLAATAWGRTMAASMEIMERTTRRFRRPEFGIASVTINGKKIAVTETVILTKPFCRLLHFRRAEGQRPLRPQPKLLMVAPMSGHFATLLRGTVEALLPYAEVYVTDWIDAREVPLSEGSFDLDDYIDYLLEMLALLGPKTHVMAVCQPSVPVLAAVALMSKRKDANLPQSMILMGGPIDTRINPTAVNRYAMERGVEWFRRNATVSVPFMHPGYQRDVYPGFMQLTGFVAMNLDRHVDAHRQLYWHLVEGNKAKASKQKEFYDEYLSVMDLTAEFYLQTVDQVFIRHALPNGTFTHRGQTVDPTAIRKCALMTVEGERDDISGIGQTHAAHGLCSNIPADMRVHHLQEGVGHFGVFSGSRFQREMVPRIVDFMGNHKN